MLVGYDHGDDPRSREDNNGDDDVVVVRIRVLVVVVVFVVFSSSHQPIDHLLFKESIKIKLNFLQNGNIIGISPYLIIL